MKEPALERIQHALRAFEVGYIIYLGSGLFLWIFLLDGRIEGYIP